MNITNHAGRRGFARRATVVAMALSFSVGIAFAGDWPQWRGPTRDGHAPAGSPQISSLARDLKPAWKHAVGPGFSGPIIAGGKLIYLDEQEGKETVHCEESVSGKEIWKTPFADAAGDEWGTGPRSTPFVNDDRVYVQSMNGEFRCLGLKDGKVLWGVSFQDYGVSFVGSKAGEGTAARRGNNGSGVIEGDYVYVPAGGKGASIVCFDKRSGKEIWKALDDEAAYSSFTVATLAGTRQLVAFTADALVGVALNDGAPLWRVPYRTGAKRHASTPLIDGDTVTVSSQTIGLVRTRISKSDNGFLAKQEWVNNALRINLATPVLVDGHLYTYGAIRTKDFVCVDAKNGATKWTQDGFGMGRDQTDYASTIAVGRNLLVLTYDGQLILIAANPEKYTELGRVQVCGKTWSHPAFAEGRLYVRDGREIQCLDLTPREVAAR